MKARISTLLILIVTLTLVLDGAVAAHGGTGNRFRPVLYPLPLAQRAALSAAGTEDSPPTREIVVALSAEPDSLYVFGTEAQPSIHVINALMDGPLTNRNYGFQPVIVTKVPQLGDGDAVIRQASVVSGTRIVDPAGDVVTYTGQITTMPQLVVTFTLRSGVHWSDGYDVTAQDSYFSYQVACSPDTPAPVPNQQTCQRTADYAAMDSLTVRWTGLPGYLDHSYYRNAWRPLPYHVLSTTTPLEIASGLYGRSPLGWGPFRMVEWVAGDHITVERNPYYWRAGYPRLDRVTFRWYADAAALRQAILHGEVQVVTQDAAASLNLADMLILQSQRVIRVISSIGAAYEHLDFGIQPADTRYAFFADPQVRQAVAYALDRQRMVDEIYRGLSRVANAYVPEEHPAYTTTLRTYGYSPTLAANLLTAAGWVDSDSDGVRDKGGQEFVFTHTTTPTAMRLQTAAIIRENLAAVGISATLRFMPSSQFFSAGPEGPLSGRKFDTVGFGWVTSMVPPCDLYVSAEIPTEGNGWVGLNYPGYSYAAYDALCQQAQNTITYTEAIPLYQRGIITLSQDLPALPLYYHLNFALADPAIHPPPGLDPTVASELWNIWEWDISNRATVIPLFMTRLFGSGGLVTVTFGLGAFTTTAVVTYTPQLPAAPGGNRRGVGRFYNLSAFASNTGQPIQPQHPYTVSVSYAEAMAQALSVDESTLALYSWDGMGWVREPSSVVDTANNIVTATPGHLSRWAVIGQVWRLYLPLVVRNY